MTPSVPRESRAGGATQVPDDFFEKHLSSANGEFVKVYLYLLYLAGRGETLPPPAALADVFSCTEGDIRRALRHWEKAELLHLQMSGREITGIELVAQGIKRSATSTQVSSARLRELQGDQEVRDLLLTVEKYLQRPLDLTYMRTLLYFYDDLKFPANLVEYLVEVCEERGKNSTAYLRTVGLGWHSEGILTYRAARARVKQYTEQTQAQAARPQKSSGAARKNKFHNFTQRMNDYDQLQKDIVRAQRKKK